MPQCCGEPACASGPREQGLRLSLIREERNTNQTFTVQPFQDTLENKSYTDDGTISEKETECWGRWISSV